MRACVGVRHEHKSRTCNELFLNCNLSINAVFMQYCNPCKCCSVNVCEREIERASERAREIEWACVWSLFVC